MEKASDVARREHCATVNQASVARMSAAPGSWLIPDIAALTRQARLTVMVSSLAMTS